MQDFYIRNKKREIFHNILTSVKMNWPTLNYYLQPHNLYDLVTEKFTPLKCFFCGYIYIYYYYYYYYFW